MDETTSRLLFRFGLSELVAFSTTASALVSRVHSRVLSITGTISSTIPEREKGLPRVFFKLGTHNSHRDRDRDRSIFNQDC